MSTRAQESFIKSIKDVEKILSDIGFSHFSTTKKGYATYIDYKGKDNTLVTFMFGPSDWNVEILLETNETKYAFKDLLQIPSIAHWTRENKFQQKTSDRIKDEVIWFTDLLRFIFTMRSWTN